MPPVAVSTSSHRSPGTVVTLRASNIRWLPMPRSLRGQLISSVWLGMAVVMVPFNLYTLQHDRARATQGVLADLREQGKVTQYIVTKWTRNITDQARIIASSKSVRLMDPKEANALFDRLHILYPNREWRLFNRNGDLIAGSGVLKPVSAQQIRASDYFQKTINGELSTDVEGQCLASQACYMVTAPVYANGDLAMTNNSEQAIGVLSVVVQLKDTPEDSGMKGQLVRIRVGQDAASSLSASPLSLQNGQFSGSEVLMVNRSGHVVFPISTINDGISSLQPKALMASDWGPLVKLGMRPSQNGRFQQVRASGVDYLTYTEAVDKAWSVVVVVDKASSFHAINEDLKNLILRQLLFLSLVTLVIVAVCQQAAKPIQKAAATIRKFRDGNFEARINIDRDDAVGSLFKDINETGASLLQLMNDRLHHAVTDQQIETAVKIQQQFISKETLSSGSVEIAADFAPAYEVGADWFDVIHIDGITYVVVADVCDKGIPSALFMSVFRSLLRYSLTSQQVDDSQEAIATCLSETLSRLNDYMAHNHGMSAMFATIFFAAHRHSSDQLHYIRAGHETPFIVRRNGAIDELAISGPAVGVFAGSTFQPHTIAYQPGDILFAYTDGLVDTRSPSGQSFGMAQVKTLLAQVDPETCTADALLQTTLEAAAQHRGKADQFDDMTILIMRAGTPSAPPPAHSPVQSQGQAG